MNTKKDEALKLALDALGEIEWSNNSQWQSNRAKVAITAIREALAEQPAQQQSCDSKIGESETQSDLKFAGETQAQQQEPIYQMQMMDGKWIDQAKHSYEYNKKHGNTVRVLYTSLPAQQQEPVAVYVGETWCGSVVRLYEDLSLETPLYTSPPASKPLTSAEIRKWWASENGFEDCDMAKLDDFEQVVRAVEGKHGIKGEA